MGGWERRPDAEGAQRTFNTAHQAHEQGTHASTRSVQPTEAPRTPEANHRLSDNDVPTQIQTAMSALHPGRLCYSGGRCACVVTGDDGNSVLSSTLTGT